MARYMADESMGNPRNHPRPFASFAAPIFLITGRWPPRYDDAYRCNAMYCFFRPRLKNDVSTAEKAEGTVGTWISTRSGQCYDIHFQVHLTKQKPYTRPTFLYLPMGQPYRVITKNACTHPRRSFLEIPIMLSRTMVSTMHVFIRILIGHVLILALSSSLVQAATAYYVATNGNDQNPGTFAKPWRRIQHAASSRAVKPGDTVFIRGGTYHEAISLQISGAPGKPITFRNYQNETPVISDKGAASKWRWQSTDQSHIRITGLTFRDYQQGGMQFLARRKHVTDIEVTGNTFQDQKETRSGNGAKGLQFTTFTSPKQITNIVIQNNTFRNIKTGRISSSGAGSNEVMPISGNMRNIKIIGNRIDGASNIGIDLISKKDRSGQPENALITQNHVSRVGGHGGASSGIYLDGAGKNIIVEHNIVENSPRGITVNVERHAPNLITRRVIIRHNILYNNKINLKVGSEGHHNNCKMFGQVMDTVAIHNTAIMTSKGIANNYLNCGKNLQWKNNIFAHISKGSGIQYSFNNPTANPSTWKSNYNFFYNKGGQKTYRWRKSYTTLSALQKAVGQDQASREGNPKFINEPKREFTLQSHSPARNSAGPLTLTTAAGQGKTVTVVDASYFTDGFSVQRGDIIRIGASAPVTVMAVDYSKRTLTLNKTMSWAKGDHVSYDYDGSGPDFGVRFGGSVAPDADDSQQPPRRLRLQARVAK